MKSNNYVDQCIEALLDNSAFYRSHPEDGAMHWAPPEVLIGIVYEAVQVAANLLGVAGPTVAAGLWLRKRALAKKDAAKDSQEAVRTKISNEVLLIDADQFTKEDAALVESFKEVLRFHGWPERESEADARKLHSILCSAVKDRSP